MLTNELLSNIADKYEEQERLEKSYRKDLERQIKELDRQWLLSHNTNIYKKLYQHEYGNYYEFVSQLADELRLRNEKPQKAETHENNNY